MGWGRRWAACYTLAGKALLQGAVHTVGPGQAGTGGSFKKPVGRKAAGIGFAAAKHTGILYLFYQLQGYALRFVQLFVQGKVTFNVGYIQVGRQQGGIVCVSGGL